MSQFLRPDSNVTQANITGGYADIDESVADDADYAVSTAATATLEVTLSNPGSPPSSGTTTVRFRANRVEGGSVVCHVYQGTTLIGSSASQTLSTSFTTYSFTPDMSSVTDWNDLRLRFSITAVTVKISWAEMEVPSAVYNETLSFSSTPGYSLTTTATFAATLSESSTPGADLGSTSSANIHAFTRQIYGEIWFVIPIGGSTSHNYYTFCVEESERAQAAVWFKGGIDAAAILDDPLLGADTFWSCLRIADQSSATLYSFDKRTGGSSGVSWSLGSSAFYIDEGARRVMLTGYHKDFEAQDGSVTLQISTYDEPNGSVVSSPSYTVATTDTRKDFRVSGKLMTMQFSGSDRWRLGKPAFDITAAGER